MRFCGFGDEIDHLFDSRTVSVGKRICEEKRSGCDLADVIKSGLVVGFGESSSKLDE